MNPRKPFSHGTYRGFAAEGCRCEECAEAGRRYHRERARLRAAGVKLIVDAGPARQRLLELAAAGVSTKTVADCAGLSLTAIRELRRGQRQRMRRGHFERVMAIAVPLSEPPAPREPQPRSLNRATVEARLLRDALKVGRLDQEWRRDAACAGSGIPVSAFFPTRGKPLPDEVRDICRECPVRTECVDFAIETRSTGFWGGMTERQRRRLRRRRVVERAA